MNKTILTLDLGTTTGWTLMKSSDITSGTVSFSAGRFTGGGMRFLQFQQWLELMHNNHQIDIVYFEEVRRHLGTYAAHCYGGYLATLSAWCESKQIPYQGIGVAAIKQAACGKGNASKQSVMAAIQQLGHNPKDNNEADALALMLWVKINMGYVKQ